MLVVPHADWERHVLGSGGGARSVGETEYRPYTQIRRAFVSQRGGNVQRTWGRDAVGLAYPSVRWREGWRGSRDRLQNGVMDVVPVAEARAS